MMDVQMTSESLCYTCGIAYCLSSLTMLASHIMLPLSAHAILVWNWISLFFRCNSSAFSCECQNMVGQHKNYSTSWILSWMGVRFHIQLHLDFLGKMSLMLNGGLCWQCEQFSLEFTIVSSYSNQRYHSLWIHAYCLC